ncbi:MAG: NAD(P)H-binding protein [Bacteroidales bacterium]|jgi:uncharacterized protein YbjT (DUF2867 family)|nr:NAD(P)H-binding protein [Bacteroidales bacterium]
MNNNTAALIGATGLIGGHLLEILQADEDFNAIRVIVRRPVEFNHPKIKVLVINFADEKAYREAVAGCDAVFVAVGTTQKKVKGDRAAYRKVDYDIPVNAAKYSSEAGCNRFLLVSSVGADSKSGNFYLKLKGEVEDKVKSFSIPSISIFRPSMLLGNRQESRPMETAAQVISKGLSFLFPSKYKSIEASEVAKAMIAAEKTGKIGVNIYQFNEMKSFIG